MTWFKVDDGFWSHPKTADLSDAATALWVRAGSWSAQHLTDGVIPYSALRFFRARRRSAAELVAAGLWSDAGDAFVILGWAKYQPSKSQIETKRDATRERVAAWRKGSSAADETPVSRSSAAGDTSVSRAKRASQHDVSTTSASYAPDGTVANTGQSRERNGVTSAYQGESGNTSPDPTRPDHKKSSTNSSSGIADAIARPDVDHLCTLLADLIEQNGSKRPTIGKGWRDSARLLLDKDGKTAAQVERAIRWCQASEFWRGVILSMPKLRERYDQLRLHAEREKASRAAAPASVREQRDGFWFKDGTPMLGNGPGFMTREQRDEWMENTRAEAMRAR